MGNPFKKAAKFVKKTVRKVVPKEVAGIMTAAAPFVAPFSLPAAAALSIGGQLRTGQGRINPIVTGMSLLPGVRFRGGAGPGAFMPSGFTRFGPQDFGSGITARQLLFGGPNATGKLGAFGDKAESFLFGSPAQAATSELDEFASVKAKQGLLGFGGTYGTGGSLISNIGEGGVPVISKTKVAAAAAAGLSLTQTQAQIEEEGEELGLSSGELARLQQEAAEMWQDFDTTAFRPNVAKGGLMRVNRKEGNPDPQRSAQKLEGVGSLMPEVMGSLDISSFFKDMSSSPDFKMPEGSSKRDDLREVMLFGDNDMGKAKQIIDEENLDMLYKEAVEIVKENDEANDYFLKLVNSDEFKEGGFSSADAYYSVIKKFGNKRVNRKEGNPLPPDPTTPVNPFKPKPIGPVLPSKDMVDASPMSILNDMAIQLFGKPLDELDDREKEMIMSFMKPKAKQGGLMRSNYALGSMPTKEESGLGGLPIEADMRYSGGFMPYGAKEKADDVPARLSKNEFVFTADAVRAAGGGSVQKGAQKMYNSMKQLESMGRRMA